MAVPGAGASFKLATSAYVLTEVATYLNDISGSDSTDELDGTTFSPGATVPIKTTLYGAVARTIDIAGRWTAASQAFFKDISSRQNVAFEWSPEGTAVGKTRFFGAVNMPPWPIPQQSVDGVVGFSMTLGVVAMDSETIVSPPATVAITSSSVANPTLITSAAHSLATGDVITIAGHSGSTPDINGTHMVTVVNATTFTIPVSVTVGGTGGTIQD